ncbi:MAG: hypothetical protein NVS3B10_11080 [Polyangiales bacterium]
MSARAKMSSPSRYSCLAPMLLPLLGVVGCSFPRGGLGGSAELGVDSGPPGHDVGLGDALVSDTALADTGGPLQGDGSLFDVDPSDTASDAAADAPRDSHAVAGCPDPAHPQPFRGVMRLPRAQILDGDDSDFDCVPTASFTVKSAPVTFPTPAPDVPEVAHLRVAWTPTALAIYVRVDDPTVVVTSVDHSAIFDGDAVELYLSGDGALTGTYDRSGADPGSVQLVITPAGSGIAARAETYAGTDKGPLDPSFFKTKLLASGYAVELAVPWAYLRGAGAAGAHIGLDVAIDANEDPSQPDVRAMWGLQFYQPVATGKSSCGASSSAWPWCDDRTWCAPVLE